MLNHQTIFSIKELRVKVKNAFVGGIENQEEKIKIIENWQENIVSGKILNAKEEEIKPLFLTQFFGDILGYNYTNPKTWNLQLEQKTNLDSTKSDAALGYFSTDEKRDIRSVIEIKDARTPLDKPQYRKDFKGSAVEQCFAYAAKSGNKCKWVIVSNFLEIRLYVSNDMNKYESFDIMTLNQEDEFSRFYYLLANGQLFYQNIDSTIDSLLAARREKELRITQEFYDKYSFLREAFVQHLKLHNPEFHPLDLLQHAQTIIDRVIFVSVIKDYDLIQTDVLNRIEKLAAESWHQNGFELWYQLKGLFNALDRGLPPRVHKINGGLFTPNPVIDNLKIKDLFLKQLLTLNSYDFESDLNVNILGHIFEQSISDIENLKKDILDNKQVSYVETDTEIIFSGSTLQEGLRKKDGIFYTPEKITQYIIENTVGAWLEEQRVEMGLYEEVLTLPKFETLAKFEEYQANQILKWKRYESQVKSLKILDPACGSGAFLTQAFDFLLKERLMILDSIEKLKGKTSKSKHDMGLFLDGSLEKAKIVSAIKKEMVSENLFGVDLNFESIEITKLGLWLKSASKNDALAFLDSNIKQGNSLISDATISDRAFDWNIEFADILQNGGFDLVVGNPPYVSIKSIDDKTKPYYIANYKFATDQFDLYSLFIEKGLSLTKNKGYFSMIVPDSLLGRNAFKVVRTVLLNEIELRRIVHLNNVFEDATVGSCIFHTQKKSPIKENFEYFKAETVEKWLSEDYSFFRITKDKVRKNGHKILAIHDNQYDLIRKLTQHTELETIVFVWRGEEIGKKSEIISPQKDFEGKIILTGENVDRYFTKGKTLYIQPQNIKKEILNYNSPKLLIRQLGKNINACFDNHQQITTQSVYNLIVTNKDFDSKFILAVLNSKVMNFLYQKLYAEKQSFPRIVIENIKELPIPQISLEQQQAFIVLVDKMLEAHIQLNKCSENFLEVIKVKLKPKKISANLENWYDLQWDSFYNELTKLKISIPNKSMSEWKDFFVSEKQTCNELVRQIKTTDKQIDGLVYQLYELTDEEIKVINEK